MHAKRIMDIFTVKLYFLEAGTFLLIPLLQLLGNPTTEIYFLEVVNVLHTIASIAGKPNHVFSSCNSDFAQNT